MAAKALALLGEGPALVGGVMALVQAMETLFGKGNGAAKKNAVLQALGGAVTAYDAVAPVASGKLPLLQPQPVQAAVSGLIDSVVGTYNALGVFTKTPAPAAS